MDVTVCCIAGFVRVSLSLYVLLCCVLVCMTHDEGVCVFADILMCMCTLLNVLILIISVLMMTLKLGNFISFVSGIMDNSVLFIACGLLLAVRFLMPSYRQ